METEGLGLVELLQALRREIEESQEGLAVDGKAPLFTLKSAEAEVNFVVDRTKSDSGGVKFYVISADLKDEHKHGTVHKLKIVLGPADDQVIAVAG
jgi:hypothetical protein